MKRLLVCLLILALAGASALAETDIQIGTWLRVVNCQEYITLREEPDTKATALDRIPLGAEAISLDGRENGFVRVTWNGQKGWALERYLKSDSEYGAPVEPTRDQRYNLNLFLSNFTEAGFCWNEGGYDESSANAAQLTEFALEHCWFNRQDALDWGDYFDYNNVRLSEDQISPVIRKYFGLSMKASHKLTYTDYRDGWYYWQETGGHTSGGFACARVVERLDGRRYRVWFGIYGAGESWDNDACYYTPEQALRAYTRYDGSDRVPFGCAVIDTGDSGLNDRSDWTMERYAVNYDVWD